MIPTEVSLEDLTRALAAIRVKAWRIHLETPGVRTNISQLRGVWGAALREVSFETYQAVFEEPPRYVLRPAPPEAHPAPALEFLQLGTSQPNWEQASWEAWQLAAARGLGPQRLPFRLCAVRPLAWDGSALLPCPAQSNPEQPGFSLAALPWPLGDPQAACRLVFPAPLRLLRERQLLTEPTLPDLVVAALRRVHSFAGDAAAELWTQRSAWLELARAQPSGRWQGARLDLHRYSGSQERQVELHGIQGALELPAGPGPLAPLLTAATWLHLGKATIMGLGQLTLQAGPNS